MADHLRVLLAGTSLSWASDVAVPTTHAAVRPRGGGRATIGGRRARDMGSPLTSRADHPGPLSCRACTPATTGGRAEVGAAAVARSAFRVATEVVSRLAAVRAQERGPGFGSSPRGKGKPSGAAHT